MSSDEDAEMNGMPDGGAEEEGEEGMELPDLVWKGQVTKEDGLVVDNLDNPLGVPMALHLTSVSFGPTVAKGSRTVLIMEQQTDEDNKEEPGVAAILKSNGAESQPMDLVITSAVRFSLQGTKPSTMHLMGYFEPIEHQFPDEFLSAIGLGAGPMGMMAMPGDDEDIEEIPDDAEDNEASQEQLRQALKEMRRKKRKLAEMEADSQENEDEDEDAVMDDDDETNANAAEEAQSDEIDEEDDEDEVEEEEEPPKPAPPAKKKQKTNTGKAKSKKFSPKSGPTPSAKKGKKKSPQVKSVEAQEESKQSPQTKGKKGKRKFVKLGQGLERKMLKTGKNQSAAKIGKGSKVSVYYVGQLKDQSIFDKHLSGPGFSFTVGQGEVIEGWDRGFKGLRQGDKVRLKIPPPLGYGNERQDKIPPNSTLTFTVEIKKVD